jgi:hypothetical protein
MSSTTCEKLVKYTIKSIAKKYQHDYDDLKSDFKKIIKIAKNYDQTILGMMEEIMDLGNVGSPEELEDYDIEVLKIYCKIKDLDPEGSDKHVRARVWKNIESEFEIDDDEDEDDSDEDQDSDSDEDQDSDEEDPDVQNIIRELPPPPPSPQVVSEKKKKKRVHIKEV